MQQVDLARRGLVRALRAAACAAAHGRVERSARRRAPPPRTWVDRGRAERRRRRRVVVVVAIVVEERGVGRRVEPRRLRRALRPRPRRARRAAARAARPGRHLPGQTERSAALTAQGRSRRARGRSTGSQVAPRRSRYKDPPRAHRAVLARAARGQSPESAAVSRPRLFSGQESRGPVLAHRGACPDSGARVPARPARDGGGRRRCRIGRLPHARARARQPPPRPCASRKREARAPKPRAQPRWVVRRRRAVAERARKRASARAPVATAAAVRRRSRTRRARARTLAARRRVEARGAARARAPRAAAARARSRSSAARGARAARTRHRSSRATRRGHLQRLMGHRAEPFACEDAAPPVARAKRRERARERRCALVGQFSRSRSRSRAPRDCGDAGREPARAGTPRARGAACVCARARRVSSTRRATSFRDPRNGAARARRAARSFARASTSSAAHGRLARGSAASVARRRRFARKSTASADRERPPAAGAARRGGERRTREARFADARRDDVEARCCALLRATRASVTRRHSMTPAFAPRPGASAAASPAALGLARVRTTTRAPTRGRRARADRGDDASADYASWAACGARPPPRWPDGHVATGRRSSRHVVAPRYRPRADARRRVTTKATRLTTVRGGFADAIAAHAAARRWLGHSRSDGPARDQRPPGAVGARVASSHVDDCRRRRASVTPLTTRAELRLARATGGGAAEERRRARATGALDRGRAPRLVPAVFYAAGARARRARRRGRLLRALARGCAHERSPRASSLDGGACARPRRDVESAASCRGPRAHVRRRARATTVAALATRPGAPSAMPSSTARARRRTTWPTSSRMHRRPARLRGRAGGTRVRRAASRGCMDATGGTAAAAGDGPNSCSRYCGDARRARRGGAGDGRRRWRRRAAGATSSERVCGAAACEPRTLRSAARARGRRRACTRRRSSASRARTMAERAGSLTTSAEPRPAAPATSASDARVARPARSRPLDRARLVFRIGAWRTAAPRRRIAAPRARGARPARRTCSRGLHGAKLRLPFVVAQAAQRVVSI